LGIKLEISQGLYYDARSTNHQESSSYEVFGSV